MDILHCKWKRERKFRIFKVKIELRSQGLDNFDLQNGRIIEPVSYILCLY